MMHLRVRNRFATDPDFEPDEAEDLDKDELEAKLASDLQHVLSALRRSVYAPPPRLAPVDESHGFRRSETRAGPVETAPPGPRPTAFDPGLNRSAPSSRTRAGGKRNAIRLLAATAAVVGLALILQSPVHRALGLGEPVAEAETVAKRAVARIIETAPVGLVIVVESAAELLRGGIDGLRLPRSIDSPAAGAHESTAPLAAAPKTQPDLVKPASPPARPELLSTSPSVDETWMSSAGTSSADGGVFQPSMLPAAELRAISRSEELPAESDRIAPWPRQLMPEDDGTQPVSVQPSTELSAISPSASPPVLRGSSAIPAAGPSDGNAKSGSARSSAHPVSVTRPISTTVKSAVNMRAGPDNDAAVVAVIAAGSPVYVTSCKFWCAVVFDGKQGWVYNEYINIVGPSDRADVSDGSKSPDSRRRCERGWGGTASKFIRQGFVAEDATGGPGKGGERC